MVHKHFSMDDEAAELLDEYDGNQSQLVSNLVKEYFTAGVYDTELAAKRHRKRVVERQMAELEGELSSLQEEFEALEELDDEATTSSIEAVANDLTITDPSMATEQNPAIRTKAEQHGIDPAVLAEEVREQARTRQSNQLKSVTADD